MDNKLSRVSIKGFKSIQAMDLRFGPLNILVGANGAGKSNLISFFKMINEMMAGRLQLYIGQTGGAQSVLHYGSRTTPQLEAKLEFAVSNGRATYAMRLFHAAGDTLIFADETLHFLCTGYSLPKEDTLGAGHAETRIHQAAEDESPTVKTLRFLLNRCRVYHFHDTSAVAEVRQSCYVGDNRWLMSDAGNLAAMLLRYSQENCAVYRRIIHTIRLIAPFFEDFVLKPDTSQRVMLNWQEKESDRVFGPHQFSDGTLRAICLITLLLQPTADLPLFILIDEPELGLHPYALNVVAALLGRASHQAQILISTQSSSFVDCFEPEDIIVVNREGKESTFERHPPALLEEWLEEYSLGEVWEKNVIGGGPH